MLTLSHTIGYAILALSCLEGPGGRMMLAKQIAERTGIPAAYLAKILHSLGQSGLILSKRGYRGGVTLTRSPDSISLREVADAFKGKDWRDHCLLGVDPCSGGLDCPILSFWEEQRRQIEAGLGRVTLAEMAAYRERATCRVTQSRVVRRQSARRTGSALPGAGGNGGEGI